MAPVPLKANWITSSLVWNSHWRPSRTRPKTCSNSGERWWTMGCAIRSESRSGTGVGPGVSRRIFFMGLQYYGLRPPPVAGRARSSVLSNLAERKQGPRFLDGGRLATRVARHARGLHHQVPVGARHLRSPGVEVEVVLQPDADVAAQRERGREHRPLLVGDADHFPGGVAREGAGFARLGGEVLHGRADPAEDAHDEGELERLHEQALIEERHDRGGVTQVEALQFRLDPRLLHHREQGADVLEGVLEDAVEDVYHPPGAVLRVV